MTVDLAEFEAARPHQGRACEWAAMRASLDDERSAKLAAALERGDLPSTAIVTVVEQWTGRAFSRGVVDRHRRNDCVTCRKGA